MYYPTTSSFVYAQVLRTQCNAAGERISCDHVQKKCSVTGSDQGPAGGTGEEVKGTIQHSVPQKLHRNVNFDKVTISCKMMLIIVTSVRDNPSEQSSDDYVSYGIYSTLAVTLHKWSYGTKWIRYSRTAPQITIQCIVSVKKNFFRDF